jgi:cytoplasmic iron level regulating protein YaaA (DUF328/UPF0246 family)
MAVDLDDARRRVLGALNAAMRRNADERRALLGVKGEALAAATAANRAVSGAPTMPAIERYTGVLYEALEVASLSRAATRRLAERVLIVSGLWGLVAPQDPIPDYKLKMGARLGPLGRLSTWWRPRLEAALWERSAAASRVWDLLPGEHGAAVGTPTGAGVVRVRFLERRGDGALVAVSHWNKLLKGALVRELLAGADVHPDDLRSWEHPLGYRLDPDLEQREGHVTTVAFVREPVD